MSKPPTKAQKERWQRIRELGCQVCGAYQTLIHHCHTGAGGRKNHDLVLGLCWDCHQAPGTGLHAISRRVWEQRHGTEAELMAKQAESLGET